MRIPLDNFSISCNGEYQMHCVKLVNHKIHLMLKGPLWQENECV